MGAFGFITRTRQAASIFQANTRTFNLCRRALCSHSRQGDNIDLTEFPPELIRNFSIIAHVDHGKSTLADRLLELTGTIKKGHGQPQYLDKLQVERERGITVKAQTATMFFSHNPNGSSNILTARPQKFLLNLVDTPGHVDFNYEVSRSLAACQGVLLVVDAAQGVQAQTVANFYLAFEANLAIIPVINKIDQPTADPDRVKVQLKSLFDLDPQNALLTSAKTGEGLEHVLPAVIERIPFPQGQFDSPLRMLLLDSYYDEYKGVICHVAVVDGTLRKGEKIASAATGQTYEIMDVGILHPELTPTGLLLTGQVGYIVSGMRSTKEARVGDTLHHARTVIQPLPGFKPAKHMVFAGVYPADGSDFDALNHAIERLTCNDSSVSVAKESSGALGLGFRCGFLGLLHMDVFLQRLEQEYGAQVITTTPTVPYIFEYSDGSKVNVQNPAALSSSPGKRVIACWEPTVLATIIIPSEYVGGVMTLCSERRGEQVEYSFIDSQRALLKYRMPLREIVVDFYNELKSITSGYASFDYEDAENFFTSLFPKSQNILIYLRENAKESNKGIGPSISPFVKNIEAFQGSRSRLFGPINCRIMHMSLLANRKEEFPSNSFSTSSVTFTDLAGDMEDLHVASRDNQELVSASTSPKERADATCDNQHQQGMACDEGENDLEDLNLSENLVVEFDKVDIEMLPTVILVGRPNVGKSALFNRLIRRREALVYNTPDGHVTRDIREGVGKLGDLRFKVLDSAGLEMAATSGSVLARTAGMTANVLRSSHLAIFLIDARDGLHPLDLEVGKWLRKHAPNLRVVLALNKAEAIYDDSNGVLMAAMGEAHSLGYGDPVPISAETGAGLAELYESLRLPLEEIMAGMCKDSCVRKGNAAKDPNDKLPLQLAIVGRPNVGKSTLLNALLLEERVLTGPEPGLTRDSVRVQFEFEGRKIYLVDTAGWLQRSKVKEGPSALSAMHARRGIMRAHIVALVLDGEEIAKERSSMRHSESALARRVTEEGRGLVVVVNKMDLLKGKENAKLRAKVMKAVPQEIQTILPQVTGIPVVFISALEGKGRAAIMRKVIESYEKWCVRLPTARLNRWLRKVMARHSWKDQASKGPKVKYFTQVKARPPTFVAFVAGSSELSETDMRFLTRSLKEDFNLGGIPIRILQRTVQRKSKADQKALSGKKSLRLACISSSDKRNVVSPCEL